METNPINTTLAQQPGLHDLTGSGAITGSKNSALSSDFETFLRMLTVQLQNQDPLNPVEASDYAVQLATFSGVEQQVRTNELLSGLGAQFQTFGLSQFAGWVGMEARHSGNVQFDGMPVELAFDLPDAYDQVHLIIRDMQGTDVGRLTLPDASGSLQWDGSTDSGTLIPPGQYRLFAESFVQGQSTGIGPVESYGEVIQAHFDNGLPVLTIAGGVNVSPDQITGLRNADP